MRGIDIPQADNLDRVAEVVRAIGNGANGRQLLQEVAGLSRRHVSYAVHAARLLRWVEETRKGEFELTDSGRSLSRTRPGGKDELKAISRAILSSPLTQIYPDVFTSEKEPSIHTLASRIHARSRLEMSTARRRAATILAWRRRIRGHVQPSLFDQPTQPTAEPVHLDWPAPSGLRIRAVEIESFGAIREASVLLQPFTVIVGANATGKTTFMDALKFIADALESDVVRAVRDRCTHLRELLWFGQGESFRIAFEVEIPGTHATAEHKVARYELEVGVVESGDGVGVRHEVLYLRPSEGNIAEILHSDTPTGWKRVMSLSPTGSAWFGAERTEWKTIFGVGNRKLGLAHLPEDRRKFPIANMVRDLLREGVQRLALHPQSMMSPCSPLLPRKFLPSGANLPLVVNRLEERSPERFESWLDHLREALPEIDRVHVGERVEDKHQYIVVRYRGGLELPAWRLSDGTLRIIALTLLAFASEDGAVFLVEEPENGIHPQAIEAVYQALSTSFDIQVLLATHSPVFLGIVPPSNLLCFSRHAGTTRIVPGADHPALKNWHRDVDLGSLFAAGVLG